LATEVAASDVVVVMVARAAREGVPGKLRL
jgi:hypothetical protein